MLPKELLEIIADAGRTRADERRRDETRRLRDERERAAHAETRERARSAALTNAAAVWAWLIGDEADELRAAMRAHRVDEVMLGAWGAERGERRRGLLGFGSASVRVVSDEVALHVAVARGYVGNSSGRAASVDELAQSFPALALAALADEIRAGRALDLVREGLAAAERR